MSALPAAGDVAQTGAVRRLCGFVRGRSRLILATLTAILGAIALWLSTRPPQFRASAMVLLSRPAPGEAGRADAAEIALLLSREIAEETVRPAVGDSEAGDVHLGISTLVDDERFTPLAGLIRTLRRVAEPDGRLWVECSRRIARLQIEFVRPGRVRITRPGGVGRALRTAEFACEPGKPIEVDGAILRLFPTGDVLGRRFAVESLSLADGADWLRRKANVRPQEGGGVARLEFVDTDPKRATEVVNALARNYVELSRRRFEAATQQAVAFIERQLLDEERKLARLASPAEGTSTPRAGFDGDRSGERVLALVAEDRRLAAEVAGLTDAIARLADPDPRSVALIDSRLLDAISERLIGWLIDLSMQRVGADDAARQAGDPLLAELAASIERMSLTRERVTAILMQFAAGDAAALSQFDGEALAVGGPLTAMLLTEFARALADLERCQGAYTANHPVVREARAAIIALQSHLLDHLRGRIEGLDAAIAQQRQLLAARLAAPGESENDATADGPARVRDWLRRHFHSRREAAERSRSVLAGELVRCGSAADEETFAGADVLSPAQRIAGLQASITYLNQSLLDARIRRSVQGGAEILDHADASRVSRSNPLLTTFATLFVIAALGLLVAAMRAELVRPGDPAGESAVVAGLPPGPAFRAAGRALVAGHPGGCQ